MPGLRKVFVALMAGIKSESGVLWENNIRGGVG